MVIVAEITDVADVVTVTSPVCAVLVNDSKDAGEVIRFCTASGISATARGLNVGVPLSGAMPVSSVTVKLPLTP